MLFHTVWLAWAASAAACNPADRACARSAQWVAEADAEATQHPSLLQQAGWRQGRQAKSSAEPGASTPAVSNSSAATPAQNLTASVATKNVDDNKGLHISMILFGGFALLVMTGLFGGRRFGRKSSDWNFLWSEGAEAHGYGNYPNGQWAPAGILREIFSGVVVTFAQVPASVAFASLAHMPSPMIGLHAAWMVGLPCALFGGRPGMIVGSAGALASVTKHFVTEDGVGMENLFCSVILAGLLIIVAGWAKIGSLMAYVPKTVMIGFCNGLAIVIGLAQQDWFQDKDKQWLPENQLLPTMLHAFIACAIVTLLPKITSKIPAHLIAVVVGIALEFWMFRGIFGWQTRTVDEKTPILNSEIIPKICFTSSAYNFNIDIDKVIMQGVSLAMVAALESLLTVERVDKETQSLGEPNRQLVALGAGNLVSGLFGTMGGTALIELSVMNANIGGRGRVSSVIVSLGILSIILFASPVLRVIPCGTLAGIMIDAVLNTAMWESILGMVAGCVPEGYLNKYLNSVKVEPFDSAVILVVAVVTWQTNLAYGVFAGLAMKFLHSDLEKIVKHEEKAAPAAQSSLATSS